MVASGLGKTQVMASFAEAVANDGKSPRDDYWITACDVVVFFASLVDHLNGCRLLNDALVKSRSAVAALENALAKTNGFWLLCLENVDRGGEPGVNGVLDDVA